VTTPSGTGTSTYSNSFVVTVPPPEVTSFTPTSGPVGTSVDVHGANFTGATNVTVGVTAASFTVASDSEIHATVPSGPATGPISVTTPSGTGTSSSSFTAGVNTPPLASFTFSCSALTCSVDGSSSSDPDGSIANYAWDFGDGTNGSGTTAAHSYSRAAAYTVILTVTDNAGATATKSQAVTLIALSARGYKLKGLQKVDLSWSGDSGASFDIYRNGGKVATVQALAYTDNLNTNGTGTYAYRICVPGGSVCSNQVTVSF
jgi:PKD repeat protein